MSKVYRDFAVGWLKTNSKGEFVSASANGEKAKVKLLLELENGEVVPVDHFFMNFIDKTKPQHPDVKFTFVTEE